MVAVESGLNGFKCSQIDLINGHADKTGLIFVLERSPLRKEYLVDRSAAWLLSVHRG
jgi:hypothetical protein